MTSGVVVRRHFRHLRADAGRRPPVPQCEAPADDGVEEALGLAGPGAGGDEGRPAFGDRADGAFLVTVEVGDLRRDPLDQMRVEQPFGDQRGHRGALPERPGQADVRPLEERGAAGFVEREQLPHLPVQVRVGEGVRGELVAEEAPDDVLGVGDGIQGHGAILAPTRRSRSGPDGVATRQPSIAIVLLTPISGGSPRRGGVVKAGDALSRPCPALLHVSKSTDAATPSAVSWSLMACEPPTALFIPVPSRIPEPAAAPVRPCRAAATAGRTRSWSRRRAASRRAAGSVRPR